MNDDELIELLVRSLAPEPRNPPPEGLDALHDAIDESARRGRRTGDVKRWLLPAAAVALVMAGSVALVATRGSEPTRVESTSTAVPTTNVRATEEVINAIDALDTAIAAGDVPAVRENVRRVLIAYAALPAGDKAFAEVDVFEVLGRANAILAAATTTSRPTNTTVPAATDSTASSTTTASEHGVPATTGPANPPSGAVDGDGDDAEEPGDGSDGPGASDGEFEGGPVHGSGDGGISDGGAEGGGSGESENSGESGSG